MNEFRPIKQEKLPISIRIDSGLLELIDEQSNKIDISRNEFIIQCINFAINNMKK